MSGQATPPSAEQMWEIILQQRKEIAEGRKEWEEGKRELAAFRDYVTDMWEIILQQWKDLQAARKELDEFRDHLEDQQEVFSIWFLQLKAKDFNGFQTFLG